MADKGDADIAICNMIFILGTVMVAFGGVILAIAGTYNATADSSAVTIAAAVATIPKNALSVQTANILGMAVNETETVYSTATNLGNYAYVPVGFGLALITISSVLMFFVRKSLPPAR